MFGFIRNLLALFGLLVLVGGSYMYFQYSSVDPCRVLAAKRSQDTISDVSQAFGGDGESLGTIDEVIERTLQALHSQYTMEECASQLADTWWRELMAEESGMIPATEGSATGDMTTSDAISAEDLAGDAPVDPAE